MSATCRRMRPAFTWFLWAWLLGTPALRAQGLSQNFTCSLQGFEMVNHSLVPVTGTGTLYLRDHTLRYSIYVSDLQNLPEETHFHADQTDLRLGLAPFSYRPAIGTAPSAVIFEGSVTVSEQLDSLLSGHWYVQMHSPDYQNSVIRGYVVAVPEPGIPTLAAAGLLILWLRRRSGGPPTPKCGKTRRKNRNRAAAIITPRFPCCSPAAGSSARVCGATDELGMQVVENLVHVHDFHATILHRLGIDHERLTCRYAGRDFRQTDVHGRVVRDIIS